MKYLKEIITIVISLCGLSYYASGWSGVVNTLNALINSCWQVIKWLNQITIQINGDSLSTNLFQTGITFFIVGIILELLNIKKGKFGKYFGKIAFWIIGFPVAFLLNQISKFLFST